MDTEKIQKAYEYAAGKHAGQTRKEGIPYITHPKAVADILADLGYGQDCIIAGLFHDLLEDTDASQEDIESLGGPEVLDAVKRLTKTEGYNMKDYVAGIRENPIAFAVKGADRLHNLQCAVVCDETFKRRYILETLDWYLDFLPEIPGAVLRLYESMEEPDEMVKERMLQAGLLEETGRNS